VDKEVAPVPAAGDPTARDLVPRARGENASNPDDGSGRKKERCTSAIDRAKRSPRVDSRGLSQPGQRRRSKEQADAREEDGSREGDGSVEAANRVSENIREMGGKERRGDDPDAEAAGWAQAGHDSRDDEPARDHEKEWPGNQDRDRWDEPRESEQDDAKHRDTRDLACGDSP
jgi:hypothetical protein